MSEVSRVSVATEVTGLDKANGDLLKFENQAKATAAAAEIAMGRLEKAVKSASTSFERVSTTAASSRPIAAFETAITSAAKAASDLERSIVSISRAQTQLANQLSSFPPIRENFRGAAQAADEVTQSVLRLIGAQAGVSKSAKESAQAFENAFGRQRRWGEELSKGFRFNEVSRSAEEAAASFNTLFANQEKVARGFREIVNQRANVFDGVTRSARDAASAFTELLENQQKVIRQTQSGIDARLGISAVPNRSAREAAQAFAGLPDIEETRAKYNPLFEIGLRYRKEVEAIRMANAEGSLSFDEMNMAIERAGQVATMSQNAYINVSKTLEIAGGQAELTRYQMTNLGYQVNDVATMFLMGASPFQIFASQAGQIVQALGDNPGGVRNSLAAIGGYVGRFAAMMTGPVGLAIGAVTAAAAGLAVVSTRDIKPIEDVISDQAKAVRDLRDAYKLAGDAAENYVRRSPQAARRGAEDTNKASIERAQEEIANQFSVNYSPAFTRLREFRWEGASELMLAFDELRKSAARGAPDFVRFGDTLAAIPDANLQPFIREAISENLEWARSFESLQQEIFEANRLMDGILVRSQKAARELGTLRQEMDGLGGGPTVTAAQRIQENLNRQLAQINLGRGSGRAAEGMLIETQRQAERAFAELARPAKEAAAAMQQSLDNLDLNPLNRRIAETTQRYDQLIATYRREKGDAAGLAALETERELALGVVRRENARELEAQRANYNLDLQAVQARTAADKAQVAGERARIAAIAEGYSATEAAAKAEEARVLSMATARENYAESVRQQEVASRQQLEQARLEFDLIGQSVGEVARLQAEFQLLAEAKQLARSAGFDEATVTLTAAMREQAAVLGQLADATQRLNMERDQDATLDQLTGELGLVRMAEQDRRVALAGLQAEAELRRQNISLNEEWAQSYIKNAQYAARVQNAIDKQTEAYEKQREVLQNVASTFLDMFTDTSSDSFFDRISKGLASINRQFADVGKNKLLEMFGGTYSNGALSPGQRTAFPAISMPSSTPASTPVAARNNFSVGTSPEAFGQAAAAVSGQVLTYAGRFNRAVDSRLMTILETAASRFPLQVEAVSGLRPGDRRFHGRGLAADVQIYGQGGQKLGNYQDASAFRVYEQFAQQARIAQQELFPELDKLFRWGGYFSGGRNTYGALDSMHFDLGGAGMGGGSWAGGLTAAQRRIWAGAESVGMGQGSTLALRTAVRDGSLDASRAISSGAVPIPSFRPTTGGGGGAMSIPGLAGNAGAAGGGAGGGLLGGLRNFMQSPLGQGGMNALSAFGAGMESGSPVSGGFSGALGAFGMGLGPVGIIAGGVAGILGGLFGRSRRKREERRQREAQERQQREQAQQQLDQQLPAILELQDTLLDRASGTLTKEKARIESQLKQYQTLAKTAKNQTEIDRLASMTANLDDYMERLYDQVRLTASSVIQSMMAGRGLEPEFAKAVSAAREQSLMYRNYIADLSAATGAGSAEVQAATAASREQLLRTLSGADEVTEIWTKLDSLTGTASQLSTELQKLGMSAEDAGRAIADHLNRGIQKMRDEFVRGVSDETIEGVDLGYIAQMGALRKRRDTLLADAASLGVDPTLINRWFSVQAQAIVNNAGLMGDELAKLKEIFPDVTAAISESLSKLEEERATAENEVRRLYDATSGAIQRSIDQLSNFRQGIKALLDGLDLDKNLSLLSPQDRVAEAEKQFRETYDKAIAGDQRAQADLAGAARAYLEEGRAYWTSSEQYAEIQQNVVAMMRQADAQAAVRMTTAERQLDTLKEQVSKLIDLDDTVQRNAEALQATLVDLRGVTVTTAGELAAKLVASGTAESQLLAAQLAGLNSTTIVGYDRLTGQFVSLEGKVQGSNKELAGTIIAGDHQIAAGQLGLKTTIDGQTNALSAQLLVQSGSMTAIHNAITALTDLTARVDVAQAARDAAQGQALQAYVKALNPNAAIPSYKAPGPVTGNPAPAPAPAPAPPPAPVQNVSLWNGSVFSNYVGNYKSFMGRTIFVPSGWSDDQAFQLFVQQQSAPKSAGGGFFFNEKRFGGEIGFGFNGLGLRNGGIVGNGAWDRDSVIARHRDGGEVWLAGGEGILSARAMTIPGVSDMMHAANDGLMPSAIVPQVRITAADDQGARLVSVEGELRAIRKAILLTGAATVEAVNEGTSMSEEQVEQMKMRRAGS